MAERMRASRVPNRRPGHRLGRRNVGHDLVVVGLVSNEGRRRRTGAAAQVVAERALPPLGQVGEARADAFDDALFAAGGAVDRVALARERHAAQGSEVAGCLDQAVGGGPRAVADIMAPISHSDSFLDYPGFATQGRRSRLCRCAGS